MIDMYRTDQVPIRRRTKPSLNRYKVEPSAEPSNTTHITVHAALPSFRLQPTDFLLRIKGINGFKLVVIETGGIQEPGATI